MATMTNQSILSNSTLNPLKNIYNASNQSRFRTLPYDTTTLVLCSVFLIAMSVFGMLANSITIYVVAKSPKLRSPFNFIIGSLSASDFISAMISPLVLYRRTWGINKWEASPFLCKMILQMTNARSFHLSLHNVLWGGDIATSIATALHILCFSFLRLFSIAFPHRHRDIKMIHAKICVGASWFIAVGCGLVPFAIWFNVITPSSNSRHALGTCTIDGNWASPYKKYSVVGYTIFYYVPSLLIGISSLSTAIFIINRRTKRLTNSKKKVTENARQRQENRAVFQLLLVTLGFVIGYFPNTVFQIMKSVNRRAFPDRVVYWWVVMGSHISLRVSECLNPVLYNLSSRKMREETAKLLSKLCLCKDVKKSGDKVSSSSRKNVKTVSTSAL